jgi:3-hydroxyisobutyrate dehydrogenase
MGTLTFMVGGEEVTYNRALPVLRGMGKNIIYCGANGAGLVVKICNNLSLGIINIATCEAMNLGIKMGLDGNKLYEVMSVSTARCWTMDTCNPVPGVLPNAPSTRNYEGGFGTGLMAKDLGLALGIAKESGAQTILGERAFELYNQVIKSGVAAKDFGVIYQLMSQNKLS